jgi:hypothetical protein
MLSRLPAAVRATGSAPSARIRLVCALRQTAPVRRRQRSWFRALSAEFAYRIPEEVHVVVVVVVVITRPQG